MRRVPQLLAVARFRVESNCLVIMVLLLLAAGMPIRAAAEDGYAAALALYDAGQYEAALKAAESIGDASGLALAARSQLVLLRFFLPPQEKEAALHRAIELTRRAVELGPDHLEANLQSAIALGYRGRLDHSTRDARRARRHIDKALEVDPDNPWARAALGGWNGEVVIEAGAFLARALFNAGRSDAIENYEAAIKAAPDNIPIHASYAKMLLRFERKRYYKRAEQLLVETLATKHHNAFDKLITDEAAEILKTLRSGDEEALHQLLIRTAPFSED